MREKPKWIVRKGVDSHSAGMAIPTILHAIRLSKRNGGRNGDFDSISFWPTRDALMFFE